jgi:hypothetical protein
MSFSILPKVERKATQVSPTISPAGDSSAHSTASISYWPSDISDQSKRAYGQGRSSRNQN